MKAKKILTLLSITLLMTGCGKQLGDPGSSLYGPEGSSTEQTANGNEEDTSQAQEEPITDEEKDEFTTLFQDFEYAGFLSEPFNDVSEIDWDAVLEQGAGLETCELSENDVSLFLEAAKQDQLYGTLYKITRNDLVEYAKTHAGVDFSTPDSFQWTYIESTDSYYRQRYEGELLYMFECIEGTKAGNSYTLKFRNSFAVNNFGTDADRVLVLNKDGDNVTVVSNAIMWEDNCDPSQTFDIDLYRDEEPVRFITYNPSSDYGVEFAIIKDGKLRNSLSSYISDGDNWGYLTSVSAIGFFDFNADGNKDIVVIGSSDFGTKVILYQSLNSERYEKLYNLPDKIEETYGDSVTIDQIKTYLVGDNKDCVYNSYQEAYAQVARLNNMDNEEKTYDLIYFDDDDIPELVTGQLGYEVSLYSYQNGHVVCYMYEWAYGAMGNTGYYYSPRTGIVANTNYDYAGAVQYESYMKKPDGDEELSSVCSVRYVWFNDVDGDGYPSDEELESSLSYDSEPYYVTYYDETGLGRSDEEIKEQIEGFSQNPFEEICGDVSISEILSQLGA